MEENELNVIVVRMYKHASLSLGVCCSCNAVFAINCTKNDHTSLIRRRYPHQFNGERVTIDNCFDAALPPCHSSLYHDHEAHHNEIKDLIVKGEMTV